MITSTISTKIKKRPKPFPKLMRGIHTGTIYLAYKENPWPKTIECIVLNQGKDKSLQIGSRHSYDSFLFEDFHGSVTLTSEE